MNITKALLAGLAATVVLSMLMVFKDLMGLMPDLNVINMLAQMMGSGPLVGWSAHFMIGTIVWGIGYALVYPFIPGHPPG